MILCKRLLLKNNNTEIKIDLVEKDVVKIYILFLLLNQYDIYKNRNIVYIT